MRLRLWLALGAAAVVVALDQLTKHWAVNALADRRTIDLVWTLRFNLAYNSALAFSRGGWLVPFVPVLAVAVSVVLLVSVYRDGGRLRAIAAGAVIGGALGNVVDRALRNEGRFRGAVVDFIDLQWWPIFNVADIALVLGGITLVACSVASKG